MSNQSNATPATPAELHAALSACIKALNTAPMFKVPSLPSELGNSYKVASHAEQVLRRLPLSVELIVAPPAEDSDTPTMNG